MSTPFYFKKPEIFYAAILLPLLIFSPNELFSQQITTVNSQEFFNDFLHLLENGETLIIDGRTRQMFSDGHLKNAINIDADAPDLMELLQPYLDEPIIVVYCTTVRRTTDIVRALQDVYNGQIICIADGIRGWKLNGFPVEIPAEKTDDLIKTEP